MTPIHGVWLKRPCLFLFSTTTSYILSYSFLENERGSFILVKLTIPVRDAGTILLRPIKEFCDRSAVYSIDLNGMEVFSVTVDLISLFLITKLTWNKWKHLFKRLNETKIACLADEALITSCTWLLGAGDNCVIIKKIMLFFISHFLSYTSVLQSENLQIIGFKGSWRALGQ